MVHIVEHRKLTDFGIFFTGQFYSYFKIFLIKIKNKINNMMKKKCFSDVSWSNGTFEKVNKKILKKKKTFLMTFYQKINRSIRLYGFVYLLFTEFSCFFFLLFLIDLDRTMSSTRIILAYLYHIPTRRQWWHDSKTVRNAIIWVVWIENRKSNVVRIKKKYIYINNNNNNIVWNYNKYVYIYT